MVGPGTGPRGFKRLWEKCLQVASSNYLWLLSSRPLIAITMKPLLNRNPNVTITRSPHSSCSFKFVVFVCCSGKIYGSWTCEMYKYSRPDYLKKKSRYSEILFFQRHTTPSFTQPEQTSVTTIKHYIFIYLFLKYVNLLLVKLYFIFIFYISIFQYSASGITLPVKIKSN